MNELGIIGIIIGAISIFLFGKSHEKKKNSERVVEYKKEADKKEKEIYEDNKNSDLESLVDRNNKRFGGG